MQSHLAANKKFLRKAHFPETGGFRAVLERGMPGVARTVGNSREVRVRPVRQIVAEMWFIIF